MWGHMLSMTVVVLSHIMSICPSAAAPQNMIIPSGTELMEVVGGMPPSRYDDASAWEEAAPLTTQNGKNNLLQAAFLLATSPKLAEQRDNNEGIMMLMNDAGIPRKSTQTSSYLLEGKRNGGIRHRYEVEPWALPTGGKSGRNEILIDTQQDQEMSGRASSVGETNRVHTRLSPLDGTDSNSEHHKQKVADEMTLMIPTYFRNRVMKRSPRCLRRCLAQGVLHPSQCHSLC